MPSEDDEGKRGEEDAMDKGTDRDDTSPDGCHRAKHIESALSVEDRRAQEPSRSPAGATKQS